MVLRDARPARARTARRVVILVRVVNLASRLVVPKQNVFIPRAALDRPGDCFTSAPLQRGREIEHAHLRIPVAVNLIQQRPDEHGRGGTHSIEEERIGIDRRGPVCLSVSVFEVCEVEGDGRIGLSMDCGGGDMAILGMIRHLSDELVVSGHDRVGKVLTHQVDDAGRSLITNPRDEVPLQFGEDLL